MTGLELAIAFLSGFAVVGLILYYHSERRARIARVQHRARLAAAKQQGMLQSSAGAPVGPALPHPAHRAPITGFGTKASAARQNQSSFIPRNFSWRIKYRSGGGEISIRTISFNAIKPNLRKVDAFCETRQEVRTFYIDNCLHITDAYDGRLIVDLEATPPIDELEEWLLAYRRWRRRIGPKP